ncbi:MAG: helix-turn-helix domain-containing protein [Pirellula sp.]|jgi:transcriptional regulator with XRE-family HTH domain
MNAKHMEHVEFESERLLLEVGKQIRNSRDELGLSQRELSALSEVSKSFIQEIECGSANPTWDSLVRVCKELNISLAECVIKAWTSLHGSLSTERSRKVAAIATLIEDLSASKSGNSSRTSASKRKREAT